MTPAAPVDAYNMRNVLPESERDGWHLGHIGVPWPGPWPKLNGDLFVVSPDNWQAGVAWETKGPELLLISGPCQARWGVFQIRFPLRVMSTTDLTRNFYEVLPLLKEQRALVTIPRHELSI